MANIKFILLICLKKTNKNFLIKYSILLVYLRNLMEKLIKINYINKIFLFFLLKKNIFLELLLIIFKIVLNNNNNILNIYNDFKKQNINN